MAERRQVVIDLITKTGGSKRGLTTLNRQLGGVQKSSVSAGKGVKGFGQGVKGLGGSLGGLGLAAGGAAAGVALIGAGIKASVGAFASFDDKLNQSLAIMGDVTNAMRSDMSNAARELAKVTRFSADEAAESYFFLASAGLDAEQAIAALPGVASFAQAGMFDMALATDLLTDAQSSLGLTVDDAAQNMLNMTRVSDVFVKANTLANTSVQQVSEAITNKLGASLRAYNIDLEEGVAVLAVYADQGLKGAAAGESFNIVLRDLKKAASENSAAFAEAGVAVFDSNGNFRNMADIVGDLTGAFGGLSVEQQTHLANQLGFQDRSFKNIQLLLGQSDAIREYEKGLLSAGAITKEVADKQMESFAAQMDVIKSRLTDVGIGLGEKLAPSVLDAAKAFADFVESVGPSIELFGNLFATVATDVLKDIALIAEAVNVLQGVFNDSQHSQNTWNAALKASAKLLEEGVPAADVYERALTDLARTGLITTDSVAALQRVTGVTSKELFNATTAVLTHNRALEASGKATSATTNDTKVLEASLRTQILSLGLSTVETLSLFEAHGVLAGHLDRTNNAAHLLALNTDTLTVNQSFLADATTTTTGEIVSFKQSILEATDAQTSLANAMREFADPTFAAVSALERLQEAQAALIELQEGGEASAYELAAAELEVAKAALEAQGALDDFSAAGVDEQIRIIATAAGISEAKARELFDTLGLIDGQSVTSVINVHTRYTQSGSKAEKLAALGLDKSSLDRSPGVRRKLAALGLEHGGPVSQGSPYLVGEAGPEVFVPAQSGSVISNRDVKGLISALRNSNTGGGQRLSGRLVAPINLDGRQIAEAIIDYETSLR